MNFQFFLGMMLGSYITGLGITHDPGWNFLGVLTFLSIGASFIYEKLKY